VRHFDLCRPVISYPQSDNLAGSELLLQKSDGSVQLFLLLIITTGVAGAIMVGRHG